MGTGGVVIIPIFIEKGVRKGGIMGNFGEAKRWERWFCEGKRKRNERGGEGMRPPGLNQRFVASGHSVHHHNTHTDTHKLTHKHIDFLSTHTHKICIEICGYPDQLFLVHPFDIFCCPKINHLKGKFYNTRERHFLHEPSFPNSVCI